MKAAAVLLLLALTASTAAAERDVCLRDTRWRGKTIDLDLKDADVQDVFRLISDVARINVVFADDVKGAVTLRFRKVPWDQAMCAIADAAHLRIDADGNVYLIRPRKP